MPKISVIVPTYNAENTIEETIQSVLQQTFTDFELLVINDGSTDRTLEVLANIRDSRLQVLTFPNGGVVESRNRGIQNASGEYLAFLDADDLWQKDKLAEQLSALEANPAAAIAYSWNDYIDTQGKFIHHGWHPRVEGDVYEEIFVRCFIENGSNILVRREAVENVGGFDADAIAAEDWDFYIRLAEQYPFVCVPKVHVLYRVVPNSFSTHVKRVERAGIFVLQKAMQRSPERLSKLRQKSFSDFYSYLFYRAFRQAKSRAQWWITLEIFLHGVWRSPALFNAVAKRRIGRAFYGLILNQ